MSRRLTEIAPGDGLRLFPKAGNGDADGLRVERGDDDHHHDGHDERHQDRVCRPHGNRLDPDEPFVTLRRGDPCEFPQALCRLRGDLFALGPEADDFPIRLVARARRARRVVEEPAVVGCAASGSRARSSCFFAVSASGRQLRHPACRIPCRESWTAGNRLRPWRRRTFLPPPWLLYEDFLALFREIDFPGVIGCDGLDEPVDSLRFEMV